MDNFHIDITAESKTKLQKGLEIAMAEYGKFKKVTHYAISPEKGLVLISAPNKDYPPRFPGAVALPFTLDPEGAADFVFRWLQETADYGEQPDHDGDNGKGWRLYNEAWGKVGNDYQAFCAVKPEWAMYGK